MRARLQKFISILNLKTSDKHIFLEIENLAEGFVKITHNWGDTFAYPSIQNDFLPARVWQMNLC